MWFQEVISSYVSTLNECSYSYTNHWANVRHLIGDDAIEAAVQTRRPQDSLDDAQLAALRYAEKLTLSPGSIAEADVATLKDMGLENGEIL